MDVQVFPSYEDLSVAVAGIVSDQVKNKPESLLCFPSGDTPTGAFSLLVKYAAEGIVDFSKCTFVGLDEWVGMNRTIYGSCQHYLYTHFFDPVKIRPDQIVFFDAKAVDLRSACRRVDHFLSERGSLDLVIVGVGTNGHIGLNEPGVSPFLNAHVIDLAAQTKESARKYFDNLSVPEKGITLGLSQLLAAKKLVLIANGEKKAGIIRATVGGPVTNNIPATYLHQHPDSHVLIDSAAASLISVN